MTETVAQNQLLLFLIIFHDGSIDFVLYIIYIYDFVDLCEFSIIPAPSYPSPFCSLHLANL